MGTMERLYSEATVPSPQEFLDGRRYKVIAFNGVPDLPWHYKYFDLDKPTLICMPIDKDSLKNESIPRLGDATSDLRTYTLDGNVVGYNKSIIKWGKLVLEEGEEYCIFRYERWGIVDRVKRITDGLYIGEFYCYGEFKGYFLLVREG